MNKNIFLFAGINIKYVLNQFTSAKETFVDMPNNNI